MKVARIFGPALLILAFALPGCGPAADEEGGNEPEAVALADQEDAVCGMLVREQSAPRSQVVHGDGSRFFFCSIGDMLVYLAAPSAHGRADAVFVEVMDPQEDPGQPHTGVHPWQRARDAAYIVGVERPGIMGEPVLSYATISDARRVAVAHGDARILDLDGLRDWWAAREAAR